MVIMKCPHRLILAFALISTAGLSEAASTDDVQITPERLMVDGVKFEIRAEPLQEGFVLFRIQMSGPDLVASGPGFGNGKGFSVSLGVHRSLLQEGLSDGFGLRDLTTEQNGGIYSCSFVVPETSLEFPDFCFTFNRFVEVNQMSSVRCFYARLDDFFQPRPMVAGTDNATLEQLKAAAVSGTDPFARIFLGYHYQFGEGVPRDLVQAYKWIVLAFAQGVKGADSARDLVAAKMTPAEIAEGVRLAHEFTPTAALTPSPPPIAPQKPAPKVGQSI